MPSDKLSLLTTSAAILLTLLVLLAIYAGTYYAIVTRETLSVDLSFDSEIMTEHKVSFPVYRFEGDFVTSLFGPAHEVDRTIVRPQYWQASGD